MVAAQANLWPCPPCHCHFLDCGSPSSRIIPGDPSDLITSHTRLRRAPTCLFGGLSFDMLHRVWLAPSIRVASFAAARSFADRSCTAGSQPSRCTRKGLDEATGRQATSITRGNLQRQELSTRAEQRRLRFAVGPCSCIGQTRCAPGPSLDCLAKAEGGWWLGRKEPWCNKRRDRSSKEHEKNHLLFSAETKLGVALGGMNKKEAPQGGGKEAGGEATTETETEGIGR